MKKRFVHQNIYLLAFVLISALNIHAQQLSGGVISVVDYDGIYLSKYGNDIMLNNMIVNLQKLKIILIKTKNKII